jgi:DNA-3-methyladenine glycosylase
MKLNKEFYRRDTLVVAKELLGKTIIHKSDEGVTSGKIVDVEAYIGPHDKGSHSYNWNRTKRTETMYLDGGTIYVYLIYGMYHCFNIVSNQKEMPEAILIRAIEPLTGLDLMEKRRKTSKIKNLCSGPGKLCIAMGFNKSLDGESIVNDNVYIEDGDVLHTDDIVQSKRINIDYAKECKEYLWRFTIRHNQYISAKLVF